MKGWKLFSHSVGLLVRNWQVAVRVSLVPFLLMAVLIFASGSMIMFDEAGLWAAIEAGNFPWMTFAIFGGSTALITAWIAVAWHRYVLINEEPGWLPALHFGRIFSYFGVAMLLGILTGIVAGIVFGIAGGLVVGLLVAIVGQIGMSVAGFAVIGVILGLVLGALAVGFMMRFMLVLPGVALASGQEIMAGWGATKGAYLDICIAAGLVYGLTTITNPVAQYVFGGNPQALALVGLLVSWPITLLGVSLLTTLYGHYVEGRELT